MDWLRWWHGTVTDPKFRRVARMAQTSVANVLAVWSCLLEEASTAEDRGSITGFDCDDFDVLLGLEDGVTVAIVDALMTRGLISDDRINAWESRQPVREDQGDESTGAMSAAERKRLQREREKAEKQSQTSRRVTQCHDMSRNVTTCHAPERDTDTEKDNKNLSLSPARDIRDSALPENFSPDESAHRLAKSNSLDLQQELDKFIAHYQASADTRADWQAQFRKWLLQSAQYRSDSEKKSAQRPQARASPHRGGQTKEQMAEVMRKAKIIALGGNDEDGGMVYDAAAV